MEFHAIICCGRGSALSPFSKVRSTGVPKALLPVANRPMIEYVLDWCERAFFPKITVVSDEESYDAINTALEEYKLSKTNKNKLEGEAEILGSAEDVYQYTSSIDLIALNTGSNGEIINHLYTSKMIYPYQNFVILPCDFITNLPPQVLIEAYRNKQDSDIGLVVHYRNGLEIEDKKHIVFARNYTIYTDLPDGQQQLLDIYLNEDIEFHKALKIRTQMSWRYPKATISTQLLNSSIFFGSSTQIFKIIQENPQKFHEQYFKSRSITKVYRDLARRSWKHSVAKSTIAFVILPEQAYFFRSNNLPVLMEANRHYMKLQSQTSKPLPQKEKPLANIGADSIIGDNCEIGEKTNVKRTVLGNNCTVGKRAKLTGCLVFNDVTIGDDVQLENCIIGHHVTINNKLRLTNCNVESTNEVAKGTQSKADTLLCFTLEGLVPEESAIEDSEESSSEDEDSDYIEYDDEYADNDDGLFGY